MTGQIVAENPLRTLTFVYDCGSNQQQALRDSIEGIGFDQVDILFLSHLDSDHVSGVDYLLANRRVETVVIPGLDMVESVVAACRSAGGAGITTDLASFLADPVMWFGDRGVRRVVMVGRPASGGAPIPPLGGGDGPWHPIFPQHTDYGLDYKIVTPGRLPKIQHRRFGRAQVEVIHTEPEVEIWTESWSGANRFARWLLIPYVHPYHASNLDLFRRTFFALMGMTVSEAEIDSKWRRRFLERLSDRERRKELRACYAVLANDHNEVSMSLYSGPDPGVSQWQRKWPQFDGRSVKVSPRSWSSQGPVGWLSTGDANLRKAETRDAWLARYARYLPNVGVFQLPHHGSNHNLHEIVLDTLGNVGYLACAAKGSKHHPSAHVVAELAARRYGMWQVSESVDSSFDTIALSNETAT